MLARSLALVTLANGLLAAPVMGILGAGALFAAAAEAAPLDADAAVSLAPAAPAVPAVCALPLASSVSAALCGGARGALL